MNINARTGSSSAATVPLAAASGRRDESADDDGGDAVALVPRHRQPTRLITCLRPMATLHTAGQLLLADLLSDVSVGG
jgi:hypothetical protein